MVQALEQQNVHKANFTRWLSGEVQKEARKRSGRFRQLVTELLLWTLLCMVSFHWCHGVVDRFAECLSCRNLDVTNMTLHFNGVGRNNRIFEALGSMLSRNALNPADVTIVSLIKFWLSPTGQTMLRLPPLNPSCDLKSITQLFGGCVCVCMYMCLSHWCSLKQTGRGMV